MAAGRIVLTAAAIALIALGCSSPEAARTRGGGPGGDVGNRGRVVQMHEGSRPFQDTPRLVQHGLEDLGPAQQARLLGQRSP